LAAAAWIILAGLGNLSAPLRAADLPDLFANASNPV